MGSVAFNEFVQEITDPAIHSQIKINWEHRTVLYGKKHPKHYPKRSDEPPPNQYTPAVRKLRKRLKINIPTNALKFDEMLPLNDVWNNYVVNFLKIRDGDVLPQRKSPLYKRFKRKLSKIDFHGAIIKIERAPCKSHDGIEGLVIRETVRTFDILGRDNILRKVPKHCLFLVYLKNVPFITLSTFIRNKLSRRSRMKPKRLLKAYQR